jgi:omega-amidase
MDRLRITIIQPDTIWENARSNLAKCTEMITTTGPADLILLPEMFTTGFSMQPEKLKETMDGVSIEWMKRTASEKGAAVAGSLIIECEGHIYNRFLWVFPDGSILTYDKHHLFAMSGEHFHYSPGKEKRIVEYKGWHFCPLICYDLRFPVWSRNIEDYDVLLYVANWPAPRHSVWKTLLTARAIENQAYCIGVNRVGDDGAGLNYSGGSAVIDPKGNATFLGESEQVKTVEISYSELHRFREKFPVLKDRDAFVYSKFQHHSGF